MNNKLILDKYTITEIDYKNPSKEDLRDLYKFYVMRCNEEMPPFPDPTFEHFEYMYTYSREIDENRKFTLRDEDGKLIATSLIDIIKPDADAPEEKKKRAGFEIWVDKTHRSKGIGTAIFKHLLLQIPSPRIEKISTYANLEVGHQFLTKLGGKVTAKGFSSYFDLKDNDWIKTQKLFDELKAKNPDIKIETHLELKEEDIEEFVRIDVHFMEEISKYSEDSTFDMDFEIKETTRYIKEGLTKGEEHIYAYLRNADNEIIGISELMIDPKSPLEIYQCMTGIMKEYRGRGLARLIKASTLLKLKDNHKPGSIISTYNDEDNVAMRKINESIGFKPIPVWKKYTFELEKLKEKL